MPKTTCPLVTGEKYHIFNRGVDKRIVFADKADYIRFYQTMDLFNSLEPVGDYARAKNNMKAIENRLVQVHAYSLLPNHFHLILEQLVDGGISDFMKRVSGGYTSYFNEKNQRSGSLFQGRYKRIHIDTNEYLLYLFSYVNENHHVHDLSRDNDIYLSSSNHYQRKMKSKILPVVSGDQHYNYEDSKHLALSILEKRSAQECDI